MEQRLCAGDTRLLDPLKAVEHGRVVPMKDAADQGQRAALLAEDTCD